MFDVYIQEQSIDPRLRNRMMASLTTAAALTVCAGVVAWGADKLQIGSVAPPQRHDVVTLSLEPDHPAPPPPPARPNNAVAKQDTGATNERAETKPETERPDAFLEPTSVRRGPNLDPGGKGDGFGTSTRVPAPHRNTGSPCLIGMNCISDVGSHTAVKEREDTRVPDVPFTTMKAIYSPDPSQDELARTRTGLGSRSPGKVRIDFCIDAGGKVSKARVAKHFPGDSGIDAIARSTVAKWRFNPMLVAGKPKAACSAVTFDIRFDR